MKKLLTMGVAVIMILPALSACTQTSNPSTWDSGYFGFKIKDNTLSGTYNPRGFDAETVQAQIKAECRGRSIKGYEETNDGSLIAFSAKCSRGSLRNGGFVEVQKQDGGELSYEGLYF